MKQMKWQWRFSLFCSWMTWSMISSVSGDSEEIQHSITESFSWESDPTFFGGEYVYDITEHAPTTGFKTSTSNSSFIPKTGKSELAFSAWTEFKFTRTSYNATIPENSAWKTNVIPDEKMGIYIGNEVEGIRYKITNGDRERFFKAEERTVGNFCFLVIRTRTNNNDVLNRERKDRYTVEVKAVGTNSFTKRIVEANTTVIINVLDVNDLKPLFFQSEYRKTVPEDAPLHKSILEIKAEDADLGRNGEIYYSFLNNTEQFGIHPTTGVVSLTRPLRYEEKTSHELIVVVRDRGFSYRGSSGKLATAKMTIRVSRVNLRSPEIYVRRATVFPIETYNRKSYAVLRVFDRDEGQSGAIKSVEIVDGDPDGHFRIVHVGDGEYDLQLLREVSKKESSGGYNLTVVATDAGVPSRRTFQSVPIEISNSKENAPVFDRELYEVNVPETSPVNTPIIRLKMTDEVAGINSKVYLEIVGGNEGNEFTLNPETGMLYSAVSLDAEEKSFYTLTVSTIDRGHSGPRKQSSAKVKVNVIDTNDNDPTFEEMETSVSIYENEPAGTTVWKVFARDRDSGENAYISYSIANLNRVPFDIDHFTGVIRTTQVIDYESMKRHYVLRVRASDWGLPFRRQTEMQLKIKIEDVNDNRPQFEKVDCIGRVPRYLPIGTEILTLSAIDFDADNIISYRLVSGNEDNCFSLDSATGVLSVTCDLMDVKVGERTLNVTATDGTHFADVTKVTMHLVSTKRNTSARGRLVAEEYGAFECRDTGVARRLTEVLAAAERNNMLNQSREEFAMMPSRYGENVHAPEFVDFPAEVRANESAALGTILAIVRARDRDLGYNGKLVFGISGGDDDSAFRIDPDSGELKLVGYLDRERTDEYLLNVTVYDLGKPQKSFSRILPVTVLDVNDNAPVFEKSVASLRVPENAANGTIVFRLNATDRDAGDYGKVTYEIGTDAEDFGVDRVLGALFVAGPLDRERREIYELKIRASDGGDRNEQNQSVLFSDAVVRIQIEDRNDNPPRFALSMHFVRAREDVPPGSVIAVVTANDPDTGEGGEIRYSLAGESDSEGLFVIDKLTGTIRTVKELDFEARQVHSLTVRARDKGTPPLYSEATVVVEIVDINENLFAPVFKDFVIAASVKENQPTGTRVTTVTATDADSGGNDSKISYFIKGGDGIGYFTIDDEGCIRTAAILDAETKSQYWLTVVAQDHGVIPLHSWLEVFVAVENENDNVPLTEEPVYYVSIPENSPSGLLVAELSSKDADLDPNKKVVYRITAGNPESYFAIDSDTGIIKTTGRKLDRENQSEHILEVTVTDNGAPPLSSNTRVIISVTDVNDHSPQFDQPFYKVMVPATGTANDSVIQNVSEIGSDSVWDSEPWETSSVHSLGNHPFFKVLAVDKDAGRNGEVKYSLKSGRGKGKFKIHPTTGMIYATKPFQPGHEYDIMVRATDNGFPSRNDTTRIAITAILININSENPPVIHNPNQQVQVTESDETGYLVALIQVSDEDGDKLWFSIVDGDPRNEFFIGTEDGNIMLAKRLDREAQQHYNLTVRVTDGVHDVFTQLYVLVIDSNDHRPEFSQKVYKVEVSESVEAETEILLLVATDQDEDDKVFYSIHATRNPASFDLFRLDSMTGSLSIVSPLDRETMEEHHLIVMAKDQGTPSKRNYAKVIVKVNDHNDHSPYFFTPMVKGKVFETSEIGSTVVKLVAIDRDYEDNGRISYSIISGNVGNAFSIDRQLGDLQVSKPLDMNSVSEYVLTVRATDHGNPPLSSTIPVDIVVTMADNAPPRFLKEDLASEIYENQPSGTYVTHVQARSTSSLFYDIVGGNSDDMFSINPSTGVVLTKRNLDYEKRKFYNLTVEAVNMASARATCRISVHVLDKNDNAPKFLQAFYYGSVTESSPAGSLVLTEENKPLVIKAEDSDSELNALLNYDIVEALPRRYFDIDSTTGAIRTVSPLDHESIPVLDFHVKVRDKGKPQLSSDTTAKVRVIVNDVNDCPPNFDETEYNVTLLLPTYRGVVVISLNATDGDSPENGILRYDILEGNKGNAFRMNNVTGAVSVREVTDFKNSYRLKVRVSDGKFSSVSNVNVKVEKCENSGLIFQRSVYEGSIVENSTKRITVTVVNVLGSVLNEHITFSILNPTDMFSIGSTSGAIKTTGKEFDRESKDFYELVIEAKSHHGDRPRIARTVVNVTVLDVNDNSPMFVNLPYYAVVPVTANKGDVITRVRAVDLDKGENGEVRYELIKGPGEFFRVSRKTGEITLKQYLEGHNTDYELLVAAYDGGINPHSSEASVSIKVIDKSMPVFDRQFYMVNVAENVELHSPLAVSIRAVSPLDRNLIYSVVKGNDFEEFALDFDTGAIYVADELDFETKTHYELIVRATDSVTGIFAEVLVSISVEDVNDCPPEFTQDSYNISVSEAAPFGTSIAKVFVRDNDTGLNQKTKFEIDSGSTNSLDYFHVDEDEGVIFLKRSLDHESHPFHHFTVVASDMGTPSLSSTAHVWVTVSDMNDNPPKFEQPYYNCKLSEGAVRGQFVTVVTASDPDSVDRNKLYYTIVGGNDHQIFTIDHFKGTISLINLQNFAEETQYQLNISVSDGVYTSFSRVRIDILPENRHNPVFDQPQIEVKVKENQPRGTYVTRVSAKDRDYGVFGELNYYITSEKLREYFELNKTSGVISTKKKFDREIDKSFEIPVTAVDLGGRPGFLTVRVRVLDENDNAPVFHLKYYKASIYSNSTSDSVFIKVKATDPDENSNSKLKYYFDDATSEDARDIFGINKESGGIFLTKNPSSRENNLFKLFVRAEDEGTPSKHANVSVEVYVMRTNEIPPIFERKDDKFFISEGSVPGSVITKIKLVTNSTVKLKLISGSEEDPQFRIDEEGQLILAKPLDRETIDSHIVGILAETNSVPPLSALTQIHLKVLDENDNAPIFESANYRMTIAENTEEGSSVLKVIANDSDQGNNKEVRYSLAPDSGDLANIFVVDSYSGWVKTLIELDKESVPEYTFDVIASDNGNQKLFAKTSVTIKLKDVNDNPPSFTSENYVASVSEDALPGTVILQVNTTDPDSDIKMSLDLYITSGDPNSQFQIHQTGEIYVAKPLDRERTSQYVLRVTATDGKFATTTSVTLNVIDANDNPPYCLKYRYRSVLSEDLAPGARVLDVEAIDLDEPPNANLRFYLAGEGADKFALDKSTGQLKTASALDRESRSKYQLTAHVQDRDKPKWECASEIEILVSDVNDSPPIFDRETYTATLPEDTQVGTLVTKLHATDLDIGINRKIKYSFFDSANGHFKIESDTGIVILQKPLDRELKAMYNLTVKASDQGTPQLSRTANLLVIVLDVNDNPPVFASKFYSAVVPEVESVGTEVIRVLATSKDSGINAEVYYSIVGGNEHGKFAIHPRSGVIRIAEPLDFERAKDYLLTIQAIDGGSPPLSNHVTVNVSVTDSNDNAPVFAQMSYSATIREDAEIGDKILQVTATDLDSGSNKEISYTVINGDRHGQFRIDPVKGYLSVASQLDRESVSSYVLEIRAEDHGVPKLSTGVLVNLEISDHNDNPPLFSSANYSAIVQEDKPPGHPILKFHITDADVPPNTAPYTFQFQSGNEGFVFKLAQDGSLQTAKKLNHRIKDNYLLHVRVFDNGTPPQFSDTFVAVKVIEESQYPPVITPLEILVNSYMDRFPGGELGRIHATDQDQYDALLFSLTPSPPFPVTGNSRISDYLKINPRDGTLSAVSTLDVGDYQVNVTVTDGKFTRTSVVKLNVELISDETVKNSVLIRFRDVTPHNFVLSHRKGFLRAIRNSFGVRIRDVIIISVQSGQGKRRPPRNHAFDKMHKEKFFKKKYQRIDNRTFYGRIHDRKEETSGKSRKIRQLRTGELLDVLFSVRKTQNPPTFFSSDAVKSILMNRLDDIESSTGLIVEEIVRDRCTGNYCIKGMCRDKFAVESRASTAIATDVTSFVSPRHHHKTECICPEGYAGERCGDAINECAKNTCPASKICIPDASEKGYTCQCPEGFSGPRCELDLTDCHDYACYVPRNPISFSGSSFAQYRIEKTVAKKAFEKEMMFSLRIRTVQLTGNIFYAAGLVDFNSLEVVNGMVQYRFDLGSGEGLVRVSSTFVSDGQWHEIRLERDGNSGKITVDGKHTAHGSAPGSNDILNIRKDFIYIGAEVKKHPSVIGIEDIQKGFIGCMDDMRLAKESVPLHTSGSNPVASLKRFFNVDFNCIPSKILQRLGSCGSQPCQNGGTCEELDFGENYVCHCHSRFRGTTCEIDTDPCASSPCLYESKCNATPENDFSCDCPPRLSGKRCQHGHHCSPNPCRNGGVCEEGDDGPICKCRGFSGDVCTIDLDECINRPCLNSATCLNTVGSYSCVCQSSYTGKFCGDPIYSSPITSSIYNLTLEELIGIVSVVVVILLLVFCFILFRKFRSKRTRQLTNHINNDTRKDMVLNSATCKSNDVEFKRGSKLSNLEISQREQLQCPPRPASYTPSTTDAFGHSGISQAPLNNLDTLRSYGSAGDELECELPPDYLRNLNRSTPVNNHSSLDSDSLCKPSWNGVIPLVSFSENSIKNGYHWDCSDWARQDHRPLPNITEVPGSEVPDSSSFHSNESNESNTERNALSPALDSIDPARDIETLNEDQESEYVGDSECGTDFYYSDNQHLNAIDSGGEEYKYRKKDSFLDQLNTYLPRYNIQGETDGTHGGDSDDDDDDDDVDDDEYIGYGFPKHERSALIGSQGNLSLNVCDIDDSELDAPELKKLNPKERKSASVTQTDV